MAWFKVDDGFWSHPKVLALPASAVALWVRAGSYSAQHLTDGKVVLPLLAILGATENDANALVEAGLWDSKTDSKTTSYSFHDWEEYQPAASATKASRAELSQKRAEAGRRGAEKRWSQPPLDDDSNLPYDPDSNEIAPTRPDPTPTEANASVPRKRGTRIDEDSFEVTPDMVAWARDKAPAVDGKRETEKFINFWAAKSGKDATKVDWGRTWKNWMLNSQERAEKSGWKPSAQREPMQTTAQVRARAEAVMNGER